ncbi:hypothetical protein [Vallitalea okinawensis]|uniref:hypothetical protein n=1 Tax=Vallitalea okinawensis TaxID=2078660 RepID=UPI000CFDA903|nr:hypothetical protein [Vallitalea okinawensis]
MDKITKIYIVYSTLLLIIFLVNDNGSMKNNEKIGVAVFLFLFTILAKHMPTKMISIVEYFGIQIEKKSIQSYRVGLYALKYISLAVLILYLL